MDTQQKIVGFIHICQKTHWEKSFDLIFNSILSNGLYDNSDEIFFIIVNDNDNETIIEDSRFLYNPDKIKVIYGGKSSRYERATLEYMHEYSNYCESCYIWYAHTKGLSHFGTSCEEPVMDWINFMCYWNFEQWKKALELLNKNDVCGCNFNQFVDNPHFSGNFWWAKSDYIKKLPDKIDENYWAPELWLFKANPHHGVLYNSNVTSHYGELYKPHQYIIKN